MFGKSFNAFRQLSRSFSYAMSEGKLMQKREKEAKLAQKIKEALSPTFVKVDDITIGSNSCTPIIIKADKCTTSQSNPSFSLVNR